MPAEIKQQFAIYRRFFFRRLRLIHHLFFPALRAVYIIKALNFSHASSSPPKTAQLLFPAPHPGLHSILACVHESTDFPYGIAPHNINTSIAMVGTSSISSYTAHCALYILHLSKGFIELYMMLSPEFPMLICTRMNRCLNQPSLHMLRIVKFHRLCIQLQKDILKDILASCSFPIRKYARRVTVSAKAS